ncbi:MAG: riboflavin synthase subunit alpha [Puniceicoccaceae bacterium]
MYTGIVSGTFPVREIIKKEGLWTFSIELDEPHLEDLKIGASVGIEGVCMTVVRIEGNLVFFDASTETLTRTTLGRLSEGDLVNIERSAKAGAEVGGHPISGHIDDMAEIVDIEVPENNWVIKVKLPQEYLKYVFNKGFIALNGCSLTVSELDKEAGTFKVYLIPETLRLTTFDTSKAGDPVNFEIDRQTQIIVDTIREAMAGALGAIK